MWWLRRLAGTRRDRDIDREIRAHLDLEAEEQQGAGRTAEDARYAAQRLVRESTLIKEDVRAAWGWTAVEAWLQDIRYGVRLLRRNPGFTLFSVASLGLGIRRKRGGFSIDAIVLRQLPVRDPERLVVASFGGIGPSGPRYNYSMPYPQFVQMRDRNTTLEGLFATNPLQGSTSRFAASRTSRVGPVRHGRVLRGSGHPSVAGTPAHGRGPSPTNPVPVPVARVLAATVRRTARCSWRRDYAQQRAVHDRGVEPRGFFGTEVGRPSDISIPMRTLTSWSSRTRCGIRPAPGFT